MSKRLYVGNLSWDTTDETLNQAFSQAGTVTSASIITDRDTGRARGFGFVEMSSEDEAQAAISTIDGMELDGRNIRVSEARERTPRGGGGGGGDRW
jgi:RNA recognition motif-containing protein